MAHYGPDNHFHADLDSEDNVYEGFAFGFALVDYGDQTGPITVTFDAGAGEGAGTVTRQGGHTDTLSFIYAVAGSKQGGTTVISANNQYGGVQFLPQGGSNTFQANNIQGTQDIFDYSASPTGIFGDMGNGYVLNGWGGKDTIIGFIAGFEGASPFNDIIYGDNKNNQFRPSSGNDFIDGRGGGALMLYDRGSIRGINANLGTGHVANSFGGHDKIVHADSIVGTAFNDVIVGAAKGGSYMEGGAGNNIIIGKGAHNQIGFNSAQASAARGVFIDLAKGVDYNSGLTAGFAGSSGVAGFDILINIQEANIPRFGSILIGNKKDNSFFFNGGSEGAKSYVIGSDGNDSINGTDHDLTVIYSGKYATYRVRFDSEDNVNLTKPKGQDFIGRDVHTLQFSDGSYDVVTRSFSHTITDHSTGTDGNDALIGTKGNNVFHPGEGDDLVYGFGGSDTAVFGGNSGDFDIFVHGQFTSVRGTDVNTILVSVGQLQFDDGIFNTKTGGAGKDSIQLGSGLIGADGGLGVNTIVATGVRAEYTIAIDGPTATLTDLVAARDGTAALQNFQLVKFTDQTIDIRNPLNNVINAVSSKSKTINGTASDDSIFTGAKATKVLAGDNDDTIYLFGGGKAKLSVDGGEGNDTAVFTGFAAQYTITGTASGLKVIGPDGTVSLSHIEVLQFSDDKVGVFTVSEALAAFVPDEASEFQWSIVRDSAANIVANLDALQVLATRYLDDGEGFEYMPFISGIYFSDSGTPTLSITALQSLDDQTAINLIQPQFKLLITGTAGDDTLVGQTGPYRLAGNTLNADAGNDRLIGGFGNDTLDGGAGTDLLIGGAGKDRLTGGADADTFKFNLTSETATGAKRDVITDFVSGVDKIDLSGIDADFRFGGDQTFTFVTAAKLHAHQLHVLQKSGFFLVEGDVNNDGKADFQIEVHGAVAPVQTDFVL